MNHKNIFWTRGSKKCWPLCLPPLHYITWLSEDFLVSSLAISEDDCSEANRNPAQRCGEETFARYILSRVVVWKLWCICLLDWVAICCFLLHLFCCFDFCSQLILGWVPRPPPTYRSLAEESLEEGWSGLKGHKLFWPNITLLRHRKNCECCPVSLLIVRKPSSKRCSKKNV